MKATCRDVRRAMAAVALAAALVLISPPGRAAAQGDPAAAIQAKLHSPRYKNVRASVDANGIATLTGTVDLYVYKSDAERKAQRVAGVKAVRNEIKVGGPAISDAALEKKLSTELAYNRVGYGNVFDAISLKVKNGVVTLGGHAHNYPNRDAAVGEVETTPGVKDVIDNIAVDPVSAMDDEIRIRVARAIYGDSALSGYGMDPARPIRISVQNGNVELYGTVDRQADRNIAYLRASTVPGVFSVKNYLQVAGQGSESPQK